MLPFPFSGIKFLNLAVFLYFTRLISSDNASNLIKELSTLPQKIETIYPKVSYSISGTFLSNTEASNNGIFLRLKLSEAILKAYKLTFTFDESIIWPEDSRYILCSYMYYELPDTALVPCEILSKNTVGLYMNIVWEKELTFHFHNIILKKENVLSPCILKIIDKYENPLLIFRDFPSIYLRNSSKDNILVKTLYFSELKLYKEGAVCFSGIINDQNFTSIKFSIGARARQNLEQNLSMLTRQISFNSLRNYILQSGLASSAMNPYYTYQESNPNSYSLGTNFKQFNENSYCLEFPSKLIPSDMNNNYFIELLIFEQSTNYLLRSLPITLIYDQIPNKKSSRNLASEDLIINFIAPTNFSNEEFSPSLYTLNFEILNPVLLDQIDQIELSLNIANFICDDEVNSPHWCYCLSGLSPNLNSSYIRFKNGPSGNSINITEFSLVSSSIIIQVNLEIQDDLEDNFTLRIYSKGVQIFESNIVKINLKKTQYQYFSQLVKDKPKNDIFLYMYKSFSNFKYKEFSFLINSTDIRLYAGTRFVVRFSDNRINITELFKVNFYWNFWYDLMDLNWFYPSLIKTIIYMNRVELIIEEDFYVEQPLLYEIYLEPLASFSGNKNKNYRQTLPPVLSLEIYQSNQLVRFSSNEIQNSSLSVYPSNFKIINVTLSNLEFDSPSVFAITLSILSTLSWDASTQISVELADDFHIPLSKSITFINSGLCDSFNRCAKCFSKGRMIYWRNCTWPSGSARNLVLNFGGYKNSLVLRSKVIIRLESLNRSTDTYNVIEWSEYVLFNGTFDYNKNIFYLKYPNYFPFPNFSNLTFKPFPALIYQNKSFQKSYYDINSSQLVFDFEVTLSKIFYTEITIYFKNKAFYFTKGTVDCALNGTKLRGYLFDSNDEGLAGLLVHTSTTSSLPIGLHSLNCSNISPNYDSIKLMAEDDELYSVRIISNNFTHSIYQMNLCQYTLENSLEDAIVSFVQGSGNTSNSTLLSENNSSSENFNATSNVSNIPGNSSLATGANVSNTSDFPGNQSLASGGVVSNTSDNPDNSSLASLANVSNTSDNIGNFTSSTASNTSDIPNNLSLASSANVSNTSEILGNSSLASGANVSNTSENPNNSSLAGGTNVSNTLEIPGNSSLATNTNVSNTSDNPSNSSTANVSNALNVQGNSSLASGANVSNTSDIPSNSSLANDANVLNTSNIPTNSGLTSDANVLNPLNIQGNSSLPSGANVSNTSNISDNSSLASGANYSNTLNIQGNSSLPSGANVSNTSNIPDNSSLANGANVSNSSNIPGNSSLVSGANVSNSSETPGNSSLASSSNVSKTPNNSGNSSLASGANDSNSSDFPGNSILASGANVSNSSDFPGNSSFANGSNVSNTTDFPENPSLASGRCVTNTSDNPGNSNLTSDSNVSNTSNNLCNFTSGTNVSNNSDDPTNSSLSNDVNVSNTLNIQGNSSLASGANVSNTSDIPGNSSLASGANVSNTSVTPGNSSLASGSNVSKTPDNSGNSSLASGTNDSNSSDFPGDSILASSPNVSNTSNFPGNSAFTNGNSNLTSDSNVSNTSDNLCNFTSGTNVSNNSDDPTNSSLAKDANVSNTLNIQGNSSLASGANVSNTLNIQGNSSLASGANVSNTSDIPGNSSLASGSNVSKTPDNPGNSSLASGANDSNSSDFPGNSILASGANVSNTSNFPGNSTFANGNSNLTSDSNVSNTSDNLCNFTSGTNFSNNSDDPTNSSLTNDANVSNTLNIQGNSSLASGANVSNTSEIPGNSSLASGANFINTSDIPGNSSLASCANCVSNSSDIPGNSSLASGANVSNTSGIAGNFSLTNVSNTPGNSSLASGTKVSNSSDILGNLSPMSGSTNMTNTSGVQGTNISNTSKFADKNSTLSTLASNSNLSAEGTPAGYYLNQSLPLTNSTNASSVNDSDISNPILSFRAELDEAELIYEGGILYVSIYIESLFPLSIKAISIKFDVFLPIKRCICFDQSIYIEENEIGCSIKPVSFTEKKINKMVIALEYSDFLIQSQESNSKFKNFTFKANIEFQDSHSLSTQKLDREFSANTILRSLAIGLSSDNMTDVLMNLTYLEYLFFDETEGGLLLVQFKALKPIDSKSNIIIRLKNTAAYKSLLLMSEDKPIRVSKTTFGLGTLSFFTEEWINSGDILSLYIDIGIKNGAQIQFLLNKIPITDAIDLSVNVEGKRKRLLPFELEENDPVSVLTQTAVSTIISLESISNVISKNQNIVLRIQSDYTFIEAQPRECFVIFLKQSNSGNPFLLSSLPELLPITVDCFSIGNFLLLNDPVESTINDMKIMDSYKYFKASWNETMALYRLSALDIFKKMIYEKGEKFLICVQGGKGSRLPELTYVQGVIYNPLTRYIHQHFEQKVIKVNGNLLGKFFDINLELRLNSGEYVDLLLAFKIEARDLEEIKIGDKNSDFLIVSLITSSFELNERSTELYLEAGDNYFCDILNDGVPISRKNCFFLAAQKSFLLSNFTQYYENGNFQIIIYNISNQFSQAGMLSAYLKLNSQTNGFIEGMSQPVYLNTSLNSDSSLKTTLKFLPSLKKVYLRPDFLSQTIMFVLNPSRLRLPPELNSKPKVFAVLLLESKIIDVTQYFYIHPVENELSKNKGPSINIRIGITRSNIDSLASQVLFNRLVLRLELNLRDSLGFEYASNEEVDIVINDSNSIDLNLQSLETYYSSLRGQNLQFEFGSVPLIYIQLAVFFYKKVSGDDIQPLFMNDERKEYEKVEIPPFSSSFNMDITKLMSIARGMVTVKLCFFKNEGTTEFENIAEHTFLITEEADFSKLLEPPRLLFSSIESITKKSASFVFFADNPGELLYSIQSEDDSNCSKAPKELECSNLKSLIDTQGFYGSGKSCLIAARFETLIFKDLIIDTNYILKGVYRNIFGKESNPFEFKFKTQAPEPPLVLTTEFENRRNYKIEEKLLILSYLAHFAGVEESYLRLFRSSGEENIIYFLLKPQTENDFINTDNFNFLLDKENELRPILENRLNIKLIAIKKQYGYYKEDSSSVWKGKDAVSKVGFYMKESFTWNEFVAFPVYGVSLYDKFYIKISEHSGNCSADALKYKLSCNDKDLFLESVLANTVTTTLITNTFLSPKKDCSSFLPAVFLKLDGNENLTNIFIKSEVFKNNGSSLNNSKNRFYITVTAEKLFKYNQIDSEIFDGNTTDDKYNSAPSPIIFGTFSLHKWRLLFMYKSIFILLVLVYIFL